MKTETIKKPTPADFKRADVVAAARDYLACKAAAEATRLVVDGIGREALEKFPLFDRDDRTPITEVKHDWRAYGTPEWDAWHAECVRVQHRSEIRPKGWNDELCPALVLEENQRKAGRKLVDISGEPFGVTHEKLLGSWMGLEQVKNWIELTLGLALSKGDAR
jgi:hypothetical protein